MTKKKKKQSVIPGFSMSMGLTLSYLTLIVLAPLSMLFIRAAGLNVSEIKHILLSERTLSAFALSFGASLIAALINCIFGFIVAWVLVRYTFPGKVFFDAFVDLPFALPTAVAGISLTSLYMTSGWIGRYFHILGIKVAYTRIGIIVALTFIGLPFVVRTLQPVLSDMDKQAEEAAVSLGASRWKTFIHVILPEISPALLTGFALALARAIGEYGSVVFISGNMPNRTEIVPLLIMTRLEEYDYSGATVIAAFMLIVSFLLLLMINLLQGWGQRFQEAEKL
ncbi:sulfate ABC transporter permease subunit CysT [bacterium]|nr:sulfate ABC transporter permease subunit CysT [bacterium]